MVSRLLVKDETSLEAPLATEEAAKFWESLKPFIEQVTDPHRYNTWVKPAVLVAIKVSSDTMHLHFWLPNADFTYWWINNHQQILEKATRLAALSATIVCRFEFPNKPVGGDIE